MITAEQAAGAVANLGLLGHFPADPVARKGIAALLMRMVETPQQLAWLVRDQIDRVGEWEGTKELRAHFCTRYCPADRILARSGLHPDWIAVSAPQRYPDPDCAICSGTGFRIVTRGDVEAAARCSCWDYRAAPQLESGPRESSEPPRVAGVGTTDGLRQIGAAVRSIQEKIA